MRTTCPALNRRRRTVEADRSKPVVVLQRRLNTVDEAVRSVTAIQIRWRSSRAVVTLLCPVTVRLCVRPSYCMSTGSITVVAACPVRAAMSRYDKPASRRPTILPLRIHSLADIAHFRVDEAYLQYLSCFNFVWKLCTDLARHSTNIAGDRDVTVGPTCTPSVWKCNQLLVVHWSKHISQVWSRSNHSVWVLHFHKQ